MLNEYDGRKVNQCEALWNVARELSRRNDLLEIDMLCKTADAIRSSSRASSGNFRYEGYRMAEELSLMAHKKITKVCGLPEALLAKEDDDDDTTGE